MGTGNSAANYIKLDNYYAMIDETRNGTRSTAAEVPYF